MVWHISKWGRKGKGLPRQIELQHVVGGGGLTGLGKVVVVGAPLLGRKIMLNPVLTKVPVKFERTPSDGVAAGGRRDALG